MSDSKVQTARATIKRQKRTDAQKVAVTQSISAAMAESPDWAAATDLQAAVKVWGASASSLNTNANAITNLREQLKTAEALQRTLRQGWQTATTHVLTEATVYAAGSAAKVQGFALDVEDGGRLGPLAAPTGLSVNPGKLSGEVEAKWARGTAPHGFLVQHATDPTNAATLSSPMPWTKTKLMLSGLASSATVSFRVAAIDPSSATGIGPWTSWVVGNAR